MYSAYTAGPNANAGAARAVPAQREHPGKDAQRRDEHERDDVGAG